MNEKQAFIAGYMAGLKNMGKTTGLKWCDDSYRMARKMLNRAAFTEDDWYQDTPSIDDDSDYVIHDGDLMYGIAFVGDKYRLIVKSNNGRGAVIYEDFFQSFKDAQNAANALCASDEMVAHDVTASRKTAQPWISNGWSYDRGKLDEAFDTLASRVDCRELAKDLLLQIRPREEQMIALSNVAAHSFGMAEVIDDILWPE